MLVTRCLSVPAVKTFLHFFLRENCTSVRVAARQCANLARLLGGSSWPRQKSCYGRLMHTPETQQKFIERRAQGWTFFRLATELGIAKSTLIEWSRKFRFEIQNRRALELEDLQDRVLGNVQSRVAALAAKLARVEEQLANRYPAVPKQSRTFLKWFHEKYPSP